MSDEKGQGVSKQHRIAELRRLVARKRHNNALSGDEQVEILEGAASALVGIAFDNEEDAVIHVLENALKEKA